MVLFVLEGDVMSTIGSITSGATQAIMMKPPSKPPTNPASGAHGNLDVDADTDGTRSVSGGVSSGKLLDLSA
jgi:hypothetical protein